MLPFHIINLLKQYTEPENTKEKIKNVERYLLIPALFYKVRDIFNNSFGNPLSPQGLLIFGAITSAYSIKNDFDLSTPILKKIWDIKQFFISAI